MRLFLALSAILAFYISYIQAQRPGCRLPEICPRNVQTVSNLDLGALQGRWFFYQQRDKSFGFQNKNCLHMRYVLNINDYSNILGYQSYWNETTYQVDTDLFDCVYEGNGVYYPRNIPSARLMVLDVDYSEYLIIYTCITNENDRVDKNLFVLTRKHPSIANQEVFRRIDSSLSNIYIQTQFCDGLFTVNQRTPLCDPVYKA